MKFKLGKTPARPWQAPGPAFRFARYAIADALPQPPRAFGHQDLISSWPMLANDRYGDCVFAGAAHETMLLVKEAGKTVTFTDADVLSDYAAVTGFDPRDPSTDKGTDLQAAAAYRRKIGIIDAGGTRNRVAAYVALDPGHIDTLVLAAYLFVAGIGLQLPASALDQTIARRPWDVVSGSPNEGGHYVPMFGRTASGLFVFVSWGAIQLATPRFLMTYCDEAVAYLSEQDLVNRKNPDGFDYATLQADLQSLAGSHAPSSSCEPSSS